MAIEDILNDQEVIESFWNNVDKTGECWIYKGNLDKDLHGRFGYKGNKYQAHIISYVLKNGVISDSHIKVWHKCSNPTCVNPDHLYARAYEKTIIERFWGKVDKKGKDECWLWVGHNTARYGHLAVSESGRRSMVASHRLSWKIHYGEIPDAMCVLHKCDNGLCVNPRHLFLGTILDNNVDKAQKKRSCIGEKNATAKLTLEDVAEIRQKYLDGGTQREISRVYGISSTQIGYIIKNKNWKSDIGDISRRGGYKLNTQQIAEIRKRYIDGESGPILGDLYSVSSSTIYNILKNKYCGRPQVQ
jgi:hypothetical protein